MPRLLFTKTGEAIWMSHLDLMRLFQRAFKRSGLKLKHSQGFSPRPSVSIALPLSVGVQSVCELLDFELEEEVCSYKEMAARLNENLIDGIQVLRAYPNGMKLKNLAYLDSVVTLEYDAGIPENAEEAIRELFSREMLPVEKKGKNGLTQQDLIPMIHSLDIFRVDDNELKLHLVGCCQNPTLNPIQLVAAIEHYLPQCRPDFSRCCREEIYDAEMKSFR